jgi:predicted ATPase/DNA-binding CsgD family transcriptional regulator
MELLERSPFIDALRGYLREAAAGQGRLVFVSGEAGIGKTSLARALCEEAEPPARVAVASCDALSTPGPLGPLIHIAPALGLPADLMLQSGATREQLYHQLLASLQDAEGPTILVGEDAHWADEASLNFLRFLGRRVGELCALVIVTYRDDELGPRHPLRIVLGDLATAPAIRRLVLPRLTVDAVRAMAANRPVDAEAVHAVTGGNPFFVSEVLTAGAPGLPANVRDAVLARAARLSADERRVLDAAAVIGSPVDLALLDEIVGGNAESAVEACLAVGILEFRDGALLFRHELAREAILDAMSPVRRVVLHRRVLAALKQGPVQKQDLAQIAHHAEAAGDRDAVLTYAPAAAQQAASLRAHRQAAAQYARALRFADSLPPGERADLLERRSYECYLTGLLDEAIAAMETALALRRQTGDRLKEGDGLRWLSRLHWFAGRNAEAERAGREALAILEGLPPGPELAWAYSNQAQLRMVVRDNEEAFFWGERAIALAEQLGQTETLVHALNNVGTAKLNREDESGHALLKRSLALARQHGYEDHVARALANLAWSMILQHRFAEAEAYLAEGLAYSTEHDLDIMRNYLQVDLSVLHLRRGRWTEALDEATAAIQDAAANPLTRLLALTVIGLVRLRRGDNVAGVFDEALALAERNGQLMRQIPVRVARAEAAWLAGDAPHAVAESRSVLDEALRRHHRWQAGELALILFRVGERDLPREGLAEPYALQIRGEWRRAAGLWHEIGCPLEEARALATGDEAAVQKAWTIFDRLGARLDAAMASKRLRELGVRQVPRGPRPATRANPAQLTPREMEVLALIAEGKPNREIAERLFLSPKTVGHHVSTILGKLDVHTRADAVRAAVGLDILQSKNPPAPN